MSVLPYEIKSKQTVLSLANTIITIPIDSRPFQWTESKYIRPVLEKMCKKFDDKVFQYFGMFIILLEDSLKKMYDAQHRYTITQLCLIAIMRLSSNAELKKLILDKISKADDTLGILNPLTQEEKDICTENNWKYIPNLRSSYEFDFIAIGDLINLIDLKPMHNCSYKGCKYVTDNEQLLTSHSTKHTKKTPYVCGINDCEHAFRVQTELKEHIASSHSNTDIQQSIIPDAYNLIEQIISERYNEQQQIEFCKYLLSNVVFDIKETTDWDFAMEDFDIINSVSVQVAMRIRMRNAFVAKLGRDKTAEVNDVINNFNTNLRKFPNLKIDLERLLHVFHNIIRKNWYSYGEYSACYNEMFETAVEPVYEEFKGLIDKCLDVIKFTYSNKYGKIMKQLTTGVEIMTICLIPIGCIFGIRELEKYFKLLIAASIRTNYGKTLSLNQAGIQTSIFQILNKSMNGEYNSNTCFTEIANVLKRGIKSDITLDKYTDYCFPGENSIVKAMLCFMVEETDSHESTINRDKIDLEHIIPQTPRITLDNPKLIDTIGNMTLFCGPNSFKLRGNRSLKNEEFPVKLQYYKESNIAMTRNLSKYEVSGFRDAQINERATIMLQELNNITSRILV